MASATSARTNIGLGSIATQNSNTISITGGSVTGITDITVADGGTGASDAPTARTNLGAAPLASPAFTGVPTAATATSGTNTTQLATTAFVTAAVTAYDAALTVSTSQIENDAVTTAKIAPTGVSAGTYGSTSAIPVVTVNAEGQVTSATTAAITIADPIGVNQTWQTVSRAVNTDYTNSTGRPIMVSASILYTYDSTQVAAVVGGITICTMRSYSCCGVAVSIDYPVSFIVPNSTTYRLNGGAVKAWAELR